MDIIIVGCFLIGLVLMHFDRSKQIILENGGFSKKINFYKNYVPVKEIKRRIAVLDDADAVDKLKRYLFFRRVSRLVIILSIFLLIVHKI